MHTKPVLFLISFTKRGKKLPKTFHYVFSKILMRQASYNNPKNSELKSKSGNIIHKLTNCSLVVLDFSLSSRQFCACRKDTLLSAAKNSASFLTITQSRATTGHRGVFHSYKSKQGVSIRTQAVKLHKNYVHFKYSLRVNKKNISGGYSLFFKLSI